MLSIPVSQVDSLFLREPCPVCFLFFYPVHLTDGSLRKAIRKTALSLWPAFGGYRDGMLHSQVFDERRHFDAREVDAVFDPAADPQAIQQEFGGYGSPLAESLFHITALHYRNGTALVANLSHVVGDGYSFFYLLSAVAAAAANAGEPPLPDLDRSGPRPFQLTRNPSATEDADPRKCAVEYVDVEQHEVDHHLAEARRSGVRVSANDVLSALSLQRMAAELTDHGDDYYQLTYPIDVRLRVSAYSSRYFGNCLKIATVRVPRAGVPDWSTADLATYLRSAQPEISDGSFVQFLSKIESDIQAGQWDRVRPFDPDRGIYITNLSRMPTSSIPFGGVQPVVAFPLFPGKRLVSITSREGGYRLRIVR